MSLSNTQLPLGVMVKLRQGEGWGGVDVLPEPQLASLQFMVGWLMLGKTCVSLSEEDDNGDETTLGLYMKYLGGFQGSLPYSREDCRAVT